MSARKALWARWDPEIPPDSVPLEWAAHRLNVAEYLFRTGTPANLAAAREHLVALAPRVDVGTMPVRVHVLLQRLFEHVTFCGMPRDIDISPDVDFVSQDNDLLLTVARQMIADAQVVVSQTKVQESFARFADTSAAQASNTRPAADKRIAQAKSALQSAVSGTDLARAT